MSEGVQRFMLWLSFCGVIIIVIWILWFRSCPCTPPDHTAIEDRLDAIELWADKQGYWHDTVQTFLEYIESTHNVGQTSGKIDFWPPSGGAGEDPPSGPPCKLGNC
jgi:hypothetical protein